MGSSNSKCLQVDEIIFSYSFSLRSNESEMFIFTNCYHNFIGKVGKVYFVECTELSKAFFTPHLMGVISIHMATGR
jgi:hypothetical protein